jgi:hypothetical protein
MPIATASTPLYVGRHYLNNTPIQFYVRMDITIDPNSAQVFLSYVSLRRNGNLIQQIPITGKQDGLGRVFTFTQILVSSTDIISIKVEPASI